MTDANTVRKIIRASGLGPDDIVVEIGPGLGSLTLALASVAKRVVAIEIEPGFAEQLPATVAEFAPGTDVAVLQADALHVTELPPPAPSALVANLPYNVSVPVLLHVLARFPTIRRGLVMVQAEVADRLVAGPGSRTYGIPSAKAAWYAQLRPAGTISRTVFWPVPNVDSKLVAWQRRPEPGDEDLRRRTFALIDAAFAQRRKTLRGALAGHFGSPDAAEAALVAARIDPRTRGEQLSVADFVRLASASLPGG